MIGRKFKDELGYARALNDARAPQEINQAALTHVPPLSIVIDIICAIPGIKHLIDGVNHFSLVLAHEHK